MCQLGKPDTSPLRGQTQLYCRTGLHNFFDMERTYAFTLIALCITFRDANELYCLVRVFREK